MMDLFFDASKGTHFFTGDNACFECQENVLRKGVHVAMTCLQTERLGPHKDRNTLVLKTKLFCYDCVCKKKKIYDVVYWSEIREVTIQTFPPLTAMPVVVKPNYDVKDSKNLQGVLSAWVADNNKGIMSDASGCEVIDHAKVSRRGESWEGSQVGLDPANVESKDHLLSDDAVDAFLLEQKESQPLIDSDSRKSLEE